VLGEQRVVPRYSFYLISVILFLIAVVSKFLWSSSDIIFYFLVPLFFLGVFDVTQKKNNILRNYPVIGHLRFVLESIRPQIQQYFIQRETEEAPFSREQWELINERGTKTEDAIPFGTLYDVYQPGYSWISHSIVPKAVVEQEVRIDIGGKDCVKPYCASRLNISAMSYGALSDRAIRALNRGAKKGNFAHNTGEGGLTPHHLQEGGDLVWQIGTGYFGSRTKNGKFSEKLFHENAIKEQVKMIELKISQGAKPGHGGLLPAAKITKEIAAIRNIPMGKDCLSPARHTTFSTPVELMQFIAKLRELSGGKPVGFKFCVGSFIEFMAICKAMIETGIRPDFITVDGAEGGTGAAPLEFTDSVGTPLNEGLWLVDGALRGAGLRNDIRVIASGKVVTGFDVLKKMAYGADMCNAARPMMFALGCVQSRKCHTNQCPTGVATQNRARSRAIDIEDRANRVNNYHNATLKNFRELLGAMGLAHPKNVCRHLIRKRINNQQTARLEDLYPTPPDNMFFEQKNIPKQLEAWLQYWDVARADTFEYSPDNMYHLKHWFVLPE